MKPEKEFAWMVKLLNSKYRKNVWGKTIGGCKRDFEIEGGASENDKEFNKWLNSLIEQGILVIFEMRTSGKGRPVETYIVNFKELESLLKENPLYPFAKKYFDRDRVI